MNKEVLLAARNLRKSRSEIGSYLEESKSDNDQWGVYDSDIFDYERTFASLLKGRSFLDIISSLDSPVVVDMLASTAAVRSLLQLHVEGEDKLGIALGLVDWRLPHEKALDKDLGIRYVAGNIFNPSSLAELEEQLAGRKADLIIERGLGGLTDVPRNPIVFPQIMSYFWNILSSSNGEMFFEFPYLVDEYPDYSQDLLRWQGLLMENNIDSTVSYSTIQPKMRIKKTPDSPESLPFLFLSELGRSL